MQTTSINELLQQARGGSTWAMEELLSTSRKFLLHYAVQSVQSDLQAKVAPSDLVQESLLDAQQNFIHFKGENEQVFLSWLKRILINKIANVHRYYHSAKRDSSRELPMPLIADGSHQGNVAIPAKIETPSSEYRALQDRHHLEKALLCLPQDLQQIIRLRYYDGMTLEQISLQMSRPEETVRRHWAKAITALQSKMREQE